MHSTSHTSTPTTPTTVILHLTFHLTPISFTETLHNPNQCKQYYCVCIHDVIVRLTACKVCDGRGRGGMGGGGGGTAVAISHNLYSKFLSNFDSLNYSTFPWIFEDRNLSFCGPNGLFCCSKVPGVKSNTIFTCNILWCRSNTTLHSQSSKIPWRFASKCYYLALYLQLLTQPVDSTTFAG